ncbi:GNAT family N-acetyltransferase [Virgibacillus flavescens]|uniref:GNAT family N-acetyltransferase n=1 Tax=Virgibacillus flavescens TaxID=1611422 RepID=UPI003D350A8C
MPDMQLKRFEKSMVDEIVTLFRETVLRVNRKDYSKEQVKEWAANAQTTEEWVARLDRSLTYVAFMKGEMVGFSNLTEDGLIDLLYVHKSHQGEGVASNLIELLEAEAVTLGISLLTVEASITARPFFLSQGYEVQQDQSKLIAGVEFINYRMIKKLK